MSYQGCVKQKLCIFMLLCSVSGSVWAMDIAGEEAAKLAGSIEEEGAGAAARAAEEAELQNVIKESTESVMNHEAFSGLSDEVKASLRASVEEEITQKISSMTMNEGGLEAVRALFASGSEELGSFAKSLAETKPDIQEAIQVAKASGASVETVAKLESQATLMERAMSVFKDSDAVKAAKASVADLSKKMTGGRNLLRVVAKDVESDARGAMQNAIEHQGVLEKGATEGATQAQKDAAATIKKISKKVFSKMTKAAQKRVVARLGAADENAVIKMLEDGEASNVSKAVLAVDAEGAFRAFDSVEEFAGAAGNKELVTSMQESLEAAFKDGANLEQKGIDEAIKDCKGQISTHMAELDTQARGAIDTLKNGDAARAASSAKETFDAANTQLKEMMNDPEKMGEMETTRGKIKSGAKAFFMGFLQKVVEPLIMATMQMIPQFIQAAVQAEYQQKAQLEQLGAPQLWGHVVIQIPDSLFNVENPLATLKVYVAFPTSDAGTLSTSCQLAGMTHLDDSSSPGNLHEMHQLGDIARFYGTDAAQIAKFYRQAQWYVSYPNDSYSQWGQSALSDPDFPQYLVNLNTGLVVSADGTPAEKSPVPLLPQALVQSQAMGSGPTNVLDAVRLLFGKMQAFGGQQDYNAGLNWGPVSVQQVEGVIQQVFDTHGIETILTKGIAEKGSDHVDYCMVQSGLDALNAPVCLDGLGVAVTQDAIASYAAQGLTAQDVAQLPASALASVIYSLQQGGNTNPSVQAVHNAIVAAGGLIVTPFQGRGTSFMANYLSKFDPQVQQAVLSGALDVHVHAVMKEMGLEVVAQHAGANAKTIVGAPTDYYVAKGLPIYATQDSYMCHVLKNIVNSSERQAITDYLVFMDGSFNIVPLMVPRLVKKTTQNAQNQSQSLTYYDAELVVNPSVEYYASLISTFISNFNIANSQEDGSTPASFPALFGMQVPAGQMYSINYNDTNFQNAPDASGVSTGSQLLSQAMKAWASATDAGAFAADAMKQIAYEQKAIVQTMYAGPFKYGNDALAPLPTDMSFSVPVEGGQPVDIVLYQGHAAAPIPANEGTPLQYTDILLPISNGATAILPNNAVTQFWGLVTDIVYDVDAQGHIFVDPKKGYKHAPVVIDANNNISLSSNQALFGQYYFLNQVVQNPPIATPPQDLVNLIAQQRSAWLTWIENLSSDPMLSQLSQQEFAGINVGQCVLQIVGSTQLKAGCHIYTVAQNPSDIVGDMYVIAAQQTPATSASLGSISALAAEPSMVLISLASGYMYDQNGVLVTSSTTHKPMSVDPKIMQATIAKTYGQAYAPLAPLVAQLNTLWQSRATKILSPYVFGKKTLGMYEIDHLNGNYIYFDMTGMTGANAVPSDYFVTMTDPSKAPSNATVGQELTAQTQYMISLVTGEVYNTSGSYGTIKSTQDIFAVISAGMDAKRAQGIQNVMNSYQSYIAAQEKEDVDAANKEIIEQGKITWSQADVQARIAKMQSVFASSVEKNSSGLSDLYNLSYVRLYDLLEYDATTNTYALAITTNTQGQTGQATTAQLFTFFDVPNTFKNAQGQPLQVGAMYAGDGTFIRRIVGAELMSLKHMYGIHVDKTTGKQSLSVVANQPPMLMGSADVMITPGKSGTYLIAAADVRPLDEHAADSKKIYFPTRNIPSMVLGVDQNDVNTKYYFYYHSAMQAYYVLALQGDKRQWISIASGNVYDVQGNALTPQYPCAARTHTDGSSNLNDWFLPFEGSGGFLQGYLRNPYASGDDAVPVEQQVGSYFQFGNYAVVNYQNDAQGNPNGIVESISSYQPYMMFKGANKPLALHQLFTSQTPTAQVPVAQFPGPDVHATYPVADVKSIEELYVYWSTTNPNVYKTLSGYTMELLTYLPVDMQGTHEIVNEAASLDPLFQTPAVVTYQGALQYCLFGVQMYKATSAGSTSFVGVDNPSYTLTVQKQIDPLTKQPYIALTGIPNPLDTTAQPATYNFQYIYTLPSSSYMNTWSVTQSADAWGKVVLVPWIAQVNNQLQLTPVHFVKTGKTASPIAVSLQALLTGVGMYSPSAVSQLADVITNYNLDNGDLYYDNGQSFAGAAKTNSRYLYKLDPTNTNQTSTPGWQEIFKIVLAPNVMYVDLATGVLFDGNYGVPVGTSLPVNLLVNILSSLCMSVQYDDNGVAELLYRSAGVIAKEDAKIVASSAKNALLAQSQAAATSAAPSAVAVSAVPVAPTTAATAVSGVQVA